MKQLIPPIATIVALIVIFIIVDRKEFNRYFDGQTVQCENVEIKGTAALTTIHDNEKKPQTEELIAETKGIINTAEKAIGIKPVAVPVLTQEEAVKANEEAIRFQLIQARNNKPVAVPVLTQEEAVKANKEALKFQREKAIEKAIQSFFHLTSETNNKIYFIVSLLPLLLIVDVLSIKRKKEKKRNMAFRYMSLQRRICILFSVSLLFFGLLVFVPWSVYFGNSPQFPFIFQDFVNWNLCMLTISIAVVCIVLLLIPPLISDYLVATIAGLGLCVYCQSMFMNVFLGKMNGTEPEWGQNHLWATINAIIWLLIVLFPIVLKIALKARWLTFMSLASGTILILEIVSVLSTVLSSSNRVWNRDGNGIYYIDATRQFQLSKEKNVIVLILDALGSDYLKYAFEKNPQKRDSFKDFVWYYDTRSNYIATFPSLIHELTGSYVSPASNIQELFDNAWESCSAKSFYSQIKNAGYDSRTYVNVNYELGDIASYHEYFSNIKKQNISYTIDYQKVLGCLQKMSGFSSAPYLLKKHFFYSDDFADEVVEEHMEAISFKGTRYQLPRRNDMYYDKMISLGLTLDAPKPVFAFHYVIGAHAPWKYDEKCQYHETPYNDPLPTINGCLFLISELIRLLKESDIYDQTAIFVCSDHGTNTHYSTPFDMLFMVKPFHANNEAITEDNSRVQSIDMLPTLLYIACGSDADFNSFEGFVPKDIPQNRTRIVMQTGERRVFPVFTDRDGTPLNDNYLRQCIFDEESKQVHFLQNIPLNNNDKTDEKYLRMEHI